MQGQNVPKVSLHQCVMQPCDINRLASCLDYICTVLCTIYLSTIFLRFSGVVGFTVGYGLCVCIYTVIVRFL